MLDIVLASTNPGKIAEIKKLLSDLPIKIVPQSKFDIPPVEETGTTFVENAIIKARHAAKVTGLPCVADDSGLEVAALNGAPGIYSSRFAGEGATDGTNIDKLLSVLEGKPASERKARFVCVIVFMRHADDPCPIICEGYWNGVIATGRSGDSGFGYDPVFYQPQLDKCAAQLTPAEKHSISHRGQALKQLVAKFKELGI